MPVFEIVTIVALIILNGFFAMSELAVVSARQSRLQNLAKDGNQKAARALELAEDPGRFLSAVQIGITLIGILTGAFGGATIAERLAGWLVQFPMLAAYAHPLSVGIVVLIITYLSLILGELVPKRMALSAPERIAMQVAGPLLLLSKVAKPIVSLLSVSGSAVLALLGIKETDKEQVTEEEVRTVIAEGTASGVIDPVERTMLEGVLRLADRPIRAIMVPRPDIVWIDMDDSEEEIRKELVSGTASRVVVAKGGNIDEPIGVVRKKDLLAQMLKGETLDIPGCMVQPLYVPEGISVLTMLNMFKTQPAHIALVVDEFGSLEGLVTPTDVLEAIAGDLGTRMASDVPEIFPRGDGSYLVEGAASIDSLATTFGITRDEDDDFHTAAGLVLDVLGRIPETGERLKIGAWTVEVVDMDGRRIDKLLFTPALN
ncbi:hemolysin family protein [Terrihabitans sp. B22-R8]|uniref:hemolysin family protein n=1 Tax=Terrihabitans sp. B22-R8 TaxID=3425128 RepID=UPI00403C4AA6